MEDRNSVYLAWQEPDSRDWHVVGLLCGKQDEYIFKYTHGAQASSNFIPFSGMPELDKTYISKDLFPLFKNRLLSNRRPEYPNFIDWLRLNPSNVDPIDILGRSGALRGTDQLQMFKRIEFDSNGNFEHLFFAHGLSYLPESAKNRVSTLKSGDQLFLCLDRQNEYDNNAVIIRADDPAEIVGYCPRYLAKDISSLIYCEESIINISVEAISDEAPSNYRLMCKLNGKTTENIVNTFMRKQEFQPINLHL